jgi:hypothetical protein
MMNVRRTFDKVSVFGWKSYKCACGRRVRRKKEFYQTQNPFNRTKDGNVKGRDQILSEVMVERTKWLEAAESCAHAGAK